VENTHLFCISAKNVVRFKETVAVLVRVRLAMERLVLFRWKTGTVPTYYNIIKKGGVVNETDKMANPNTAVSRINYPVG